MHRTFGILYVFALALCVGVAAGYGGPSLQAIAHNEAKYFGNPQAAITHTETVRIGRTRWAMIQMKGHRAFRVACLPLGAIALGGACHPRYLVLGVKLANHEVGLYWGLTASQVSAIARARQASQRFRIFPDVTNLYVRCAIPQGGLHTGALTGTCSTVAQPDNHVKRVKFVETWKLRASGPLMTAGWVVTLNPGGRVQSVRVTGQPPQLWK
jgi:hypothetical protein